MASPTTWDTHIIPLFAPSVQIPYISLPSLPDYRLLYPKAIPSPQTILSCRNMPIPCGAPDDDVQFYYSSCRWSHFQSASHIPRSHSLSLSLSFLGCLVGHQLHETSKTWPVKISRFPHLHVLLVRLAPVTSILLYSILLSSTLSYPIFSPIIQQTPITKDRRGWQTHTISRPPF